MVEPAQRIAHWYARYVEKVCARPRFAALLLALFCLPALSLTALYFADVRAGLLELLPADAPSVRALEKIHARLGGQSHLTVIAQSDFPEANRRFIEEISARLAALHLPEARSIQANVAHERAWSESRAPLLMPRERFDALLDELDDAIRAAKIRASPFNLGLDDGDEEPLKRLQQKFEDELKAADRYPHGYIETADGKTVVNLIWLEGSEVDFVPADRLLSAAMREAEAIRGKYPPSLKVAWQGEVANMVEEHAAIVADLSLSSLLVFLVVTLLIAVYFRSARGVAAIFMGLVPGLLLTFAFGRLWAGSLNSNTAFLGSIIGGNGINYPLIFLAYYRACDPAWSTSRSIAEAARRAFPGTLGAAVTASAAYAGLAAATFKGFSQFGTLGGVGMLTTWCLCFFAMPIAIALFSPPRQGEPHTRSQRLLLGYFARPRAPQAVAAILVALFLLGGLAGVWRARQSGLYEMDLRKLRNRESLAHGSASWDQKMYEVFGVWLNPVVCLTADEKSRPAAAAELRRVLMGGERPIAERVVTIAAYVPPLADQEARLSRLKKLADQFERFKDLDGVKERIPDRAWRLVTLWLAKGSLAPITVDEVPRTLLQGLTEVSGATDRVVLLFPSRFIDFEDGNNILAFSDRLAAAWLPEGSIAGGGFVFMAEIIRLVRDEAPRVVLVVCVLVALSLLPLYLRRPRRIGVTVASVAAVAVLAQASMVAMGVRVNMLNFAAVPITIGVGADYVVNLWGAMDAFGTDARRACARMGGAILLCSLTTAVGYLSLVVAQSGALRSFGWAAVLGEVMAVTTVLLVLPPFLCRSGSDSTGEIG